jgi:hypothetical protein
MKIPVVKEYGSWAVFIFSCAAGITTGFLSRPWQRGRVYSLILLLTVLGMTLLINAKNPLTNLTRSKGDKRNDLFWLVLFGSAGGILLIPFMREGLSDFFVFSPLIIIYILLLCSGKEHSLITEINGFALLTLSAPALYFVITGEASPRLFIAVFVFFAAGVFKVRMRLKKTLFFRWVMAVYCVCSVVIYVLVIDISAAVLLPLLENLIAGVRRKGGRLRTTGNIELVKGAIFTVLLGIFWK